MGSLVVIFFNFLFLTVMIHNVTLCRRSDFHDVDLKSVTSI